MTRARLSPEREEQIRTQLTGMEHVRELLSEIDALRANIKSFYNTAAENHEKYCFFREQRDQLKADIAYSEKELNSLKDIVKLRGNAVEHLQKENEKLKERIGKYEVLLKRCKHALAQDEEKQK